MLRIWVISDTHFGHQNMYRFTKNDGITRIRPEFEDCFEADRAMIERWNALVTPEDHVWHLGDIGMGQPPKYYHEIVRELKGQKRVILGNHDKFKMQEYIAMGFQKVMGSAYKDGIWLTHIPVHPDGLYGGRINAHGHIHERHITKVRPKDFNDLGIAAEWETFKDSRYVNVCVEQTNYAPIRLEEVRQRHQKMQMAERGLDYGGEQV
jgi:calcineurin-like phosphoesterase family protein